MGQNCSVILELPPLPHRRWYRVRGTKYEESFPNPAALLFVSKYVIVELNLDSASLYGVRTKNKQRVLLSPFLFRRLKHKH